MTDLAVAIVVFTIFAGVIGTLFYSSFKVNVQTKLSGSAVNYAIQILEDIDKLTYEQVTNGMEQQYMTKFSIPSGYQLLLEVSNYNEGNDKEDLIKKVKLTISYGLTGETENIVIEKLKIKEL